jgi:DNA-directed RNA polymerase specialized sigma24 family protein
MRTRTNLIEQLSSFDPDERLVTLRGFFDCHHRLVVSFAHRALQRAKSRGDFVPFEPDEVAHGAYLRLEARLKRARLIIVRGWGGWCSYVKRAVLSTARDAKRRAQRAQRSQQIPTFGVQEDSGPHLHAMRHFKYWFGPVASNEPSNTDLETVTIQAGVECSQRSDSKNQTQLVMEAASRCLTRPQYELFRRFVDQVAGDAYTVAQAAKRIGAPAEKIHAVLRAIRAQVAA